MNKVLSFAIIVLIFACILNGENSTQQAFVSVFGDKIVEPRQDYITIQFQYGVSDFDTISSVMLTGTINTSQSMAIINTGTDANGFAQLQSQATLPYQPGHEGDVFFTALFPDGGQANSTQWIGLFDNDDGAAIGYNNTDFAILFRRGGVDMIITQTNFNCDPLNGTGPSGITIDTENLNVFRISYGWLGSAPIRYQILRNDGKWFTFHLIEQPNSSAGPSFLNPVLPMVAQVKKINGSLSNVRIGTASWNASVVECPTTSGSRFFSVNSTNATIGTTETHLLSIRNNVTFSGLPNKVAVVIKLFTGGVTSSSTQVGIFRFRKNSTGLSGFMSVNANSVVDFTTTGGFSGGEVIITAPVATRGHGSVFEFLQTTPIVLFPGDRLTITAQEILTAAGIPFFVSLGWEERF